MTTCCDVSGGFPDAGLAKELSKDHALIWAEICVIQQAILAATSGCELDPATGTCVSKGGGFCVTIGGSSPMTWISGIESILVTAGGSGYIPVIAEAVYTRPSGATGIDAVTVVNVALSVIESIDITSGGTGYNPISVIADLSGAGGDADITFVVDNITGIIVDYAIVSEGTGYSTGPLVMTHPIGIGASIEIDAIGGSGEITSLNIIAGGIDYQTLITTVEILHPSGAGFMGVVQTSGTAISGVSIQNSGILYNDLYPVVSVTDGAGETTVINLLAGAVDTVDVLNGGTRFVEDSVGTVISVDDVAGDPVGSGATIDVTVHVNPHGSDTYEYYLALIGAIDNCGAISEIEAVIFYFTQLGYTITPIPNDETGTISWEVCWC